MKKEKNKKILLTGGHAATTAIAVIEELIRRGRGDDIYWIGAESAVEGKKLPTLDSKIFPKLGVKSYSIISGRLQRKFTIWTVPSLLKIPLGFIQAFGAVIKIRPSVVLSFGGHSAFPVVFASRLLGIPIVVHEQTYALGLANRLSAPFAKKILLSRDLGNPVMTQITEVEPKFKLGDPPTILVMGGSRGSQIINSVIVKSLPILLKNFRIIHITGEIDFPKLAGLASDRYEVFPWVDPLQIDGLYRQSDIVVGRAGANTVSELMIVKRPCILIPIPWSQRDEQSVNARKAESFGIGRVITQNELTPERLNNELRKITDNWEEIVNRVKDKKTPDIEASGKVVDVLEGYLR